MNTPLACPITNVAPLLPHSGPMVMLDCISDYGADYLTATASVGENHILLCNNRLPCLSGIEIMAQGIGALVGCHAVNSGEAVKLGFLLGTRKLDLFADNVPVGTKLTVKVKESMRDAGGFGVFDCTLHWTDAPEHEKHLLPADGLLLQAALNVYSPNETKSA
ncbi:thioester dehydrase [Neisseria dumasiana]|uniref:Thioester dehydrase n=1 Tax=Neisseria dumasiana TaxID=1931275 RepID=A0ABX3WMG3_9NEIS|nr:thioester dehydrase [Neisseria dumasiana]OSI34008.1 thioester dehydrase [Neisseria dumasiana]UOO83385.1 thioester dehydrase [Neisseria dumasiana]